MYSVSADFLSAMSQPIQTHKITGTIGSASFGPANILAGSFSVNNKICDSNEIGIGNVYIGELTATFRGVAIADGAWNGQVITPTFSLLTDPDTDTWEDVPLGVFTVTEATISASGVTVKAYDNMAKFDKYCTTYHGSGGGSGAAGAASIVLGRTAYPLAVLICSKCGVQFGMTWGTVAALPNGTKSLTIFDDNDITTYRDLISWLAQTLCSNATIDRTGKLVFVPFHSTSDYTFDDEHRHEGASFKDFATKITQVWLDCKPMEISYEYHVSPNNGLSYELGQNPFLQIGTDADRDTAMNNILTGLQNVNYTPFDVSLTGCPIFDLGDVLTFTDGILSSSKNGAVTSYTYTYNAAYKLACGGKNPAEANAKSSTDKRLDGVSSSVSSQESLVSVVRNADAVNIADGGLVEVLSYPFEVTDSVNLTNVSTEIVMTTTGTETEAADIYTIGDIVARVVLFLDGIEIGDLYPQFIVDEGKDTINFDYALKNLSVGAHTYTVKLQMAGGSSAILANDVHEFLWGEGITFKVYLKRIQVTSGTNVFRINDALDTTDWNVRGINNNGTTIPSLSGWTTDPADGTTLTEKGTVDVEVDYGGIVTEYPVEVVYAPYDGCKVYFYDQYLELWDENGQKEGVRNIYNGTLYGNDHEFISISSGTIRYEGRDVRTSSSPANTPEKLQGAKGGYVYSVFDGNNTRTFYLVHGDSEEGDIDEEEIGSYNSATSTFWFVCPGYFYGNIIGFTDGTNYGYIDLNAKTVVANFVDMAAIGFTGGAINTDWRGAALRLENGDEYIFIGCGVPKFIHTYRNGVHAYHDMSAIDDLANDSTNFFRYGLYHDQTGNNLVLYVCKVYNSNMQWYTVVTRCYKLSMNGQTKIGTVALPSYLDVPVDPNSTEIAAYEQASYFRLWFNGSNLNCYFPSTVDGIRLTTVDMLFDFYDTGGTGYLSKPKNYVDFSGVDKMPCEQQYLIGKTYTASIYNYVQRCVYIDNLYMEDSPNNIVKEW